jgi:hypothetical protein
VFAKRATLCNLPVIILKLHFISWDYPFEAWRNVLFAIKVCKSKNKIQEGGEEKGGITEDKSYEQIIEKEIENLSRIKLPTCYIVICKHKAAADLGVSNLGMATKDSSTAYCAQKMGGGKYSSSIYLSLWFW